MDQAKRDRTSTTVNPRLFDPKSGSLELVFSDGASYSFPLSKSYHRQETFYVDLLWEQTQSGLSLSLALHPKGEDLTLRSCSISWSLPHGFPQEIQTYGFVRPVSPGWTKPHTNHKAPTFLEKYALKKLNAYDPLPHPSTRTASYQAIVLRDNQFTLQLESTDESAALTIFTLSPNGAVLSAENQSKGFNLRHTFPAFELHFKTSKSRKSTPAKKRASVVSLAVSSEWLKHGDVERLTTSSLVAESNFSSLVLKKHEGPCLSSTGFDESTYAAFAKTCFSANLQAGVVLSPFVVPSHTTAGGVSVMPERRWSASLQQHVHPIDLEDEQTMQICEQFLLSFYKKGFRFFLLDDVAISLRDQAGSSTTGQQLHKRLALLLRLLPEATILFADFCSPNGFPDFAGCRTADYERNMLPAIARFVGLGEPPVKHGKLKPFRVNSSNYTGAIQSNAREEHKLLDLSERRLDATHWRALESTLGTADYPTRLQ